jgi:cold shock CspA family protein
MFCLRIIKIIYNMKGSIVRKRDEGYGFIKPEDGEKDVFFHASALVDIAFDDLKEGDVVTFEVAHGS